MKSQPIAMSAACQAILEKIASQRTASVREVERSAILLKLQTGMSSNNIAKSLLTSWLKIQRLRNRWISFEEALATIESREGEKTVHQALRQQLREVLADEVRPGTPAKFSSHDYCNMLAVRLEDPELSQRPISHWSLSELKAEIEKRGIVASISRAQLGAFLTAERRETTPSTGLAQPGLSRGSVGKGIGGNLPHLPKRRHGLGNAAAENRQHG